MENGSDLFGFGFWNLDFDFGFVGLIQSNGADFFILWV